MIQLILILDNVRSAHNVGALLRTADSLGVEWVYAAGITPYPELANDPRDPIVRRRNTRAIAKTALGAEQSISIEHFDDTFAAIAAARVQGCTIYGLEQTPGSTSLADVRPAARVALVVGNEVTGLSPATLATCDMTIEIPQRGHKESMNVAVAAGIAMYQLMK